MTEQIKKIQDLENEIWKPIIGFEGLYEVSNRARVKSLVDRWRNNKITFKERLLKINKVGKGYYGLMLRDNDRCVRFTIHRLVAVHFIPNPLNLPLVHHKKGLKHLNWDIDLEWSTAKQNINHAFDTGLNIKIQKNDPRRSKPVLQLNLSGSQVAEYPSLIQVERSTGFRCPNIHYAIRNKIISNGYLWKYKN